MFDPPTKRMRNDSMKQSILHSLEKREITACTNSTLKTLPSAASRLPVIWRKRPINPGSKNKIFASQWISNNHIVYGTKCNQLVLYDCSTQTSLTIPLIEACSHEPSPACVCGIHAIQSNPSKTLLATGGANVTNVGVYTLPDFSPYSLLKDCHTDWVFDLRWLDDNYLASCSRDSSLALWRIPQPRNNAARTCVSSSLHRKTLQRVIPVNTPVGQVYSSIANDRFRALEHMPVGNLLSVVSMSRRFYLYDALRIGSGTNTNPLHMLVLPDTFQEAVALRRLPSNPHCVALASHFCVLIFDIRCAKPLGVTGSFVHPQPGVSGIRSLNFATDLLSYGASNGRVYFYDLRAGQHLPVHLDIGPGWINPTPCPLDSLRSFSVFNELDFPESTMPETIQNQFPPPVYLPGFSRSNHIRVHVDRNQSFDPDARTRRFAAMLSHLTRRRQRLMVPTIGTLGSRRRPVNLSEIEARLVDPSLTGQNSEEYTTSSNVGIDDTPSAATSPAAFMPSPPSDDLRYYSLLNILTEVSTVPSPLSYQRMMAVYTHEYDESGTRLFTAGGPIASSACGNAAALWE